MVRGFLAIVSTVGGLACNGPVGLLPGGVLDGSVAATPASWSFAGDSGTMQLESRPQDPYSVNLAYTVVDGRLYVNAGGTETRWVENLAADPLVRMRLDGALYELRARRVTDSDEIEGFAEAWTGQSFFRRDPRKVPEAWIFELVAR